MSPRPFTRGAGPSRRRKWICPRSRIRNVAQGIRTWPKKNTSASAKAGRGRLSPMSPRWRWWAISGRTQKRRDPPGGFATPSPVGSSAPITTHAQKQRKDQVAGPFLLIRIGRTSFGLRGQKEHFRTFDGNQFGGKHLCTELRSRFLLLGCTRFSFYSDRASSLPRPRSVGSGCTPVPDRPHGPPEFQPLIFRPPAFWDGRTYPGEADRFLRTSKGSALAVPFLSVYVNLSLPSGLFRRQPLKKTMIKKCLSLFEAFHTLKLRPDHLLYRGDGNIVFISPSVSISGC